MDHYRGGPHMVEIIFTTGTKYAILVQQGTKYACNDNNNGDLIWMQSQFQREVDMLAISNA